MRLKGFLLIVLALVIVASAMVVVRLPVPSIPEASGVSEELARERSVRISGLSYDLHLKVPATRQESIRGSMEATFTLPGASRPIVFDFAQPGDRLVSVRANGQTLQTAVTNGHITVPATFLVRGRNTVIFEFIAGDDALNRQDEFLYSLFVPARARQTFPCFDQPDLKARWRLTLDVPPSWSAVSNGRESGRVASAEHTAFLFEETAPISTYLFAFAAGKFAVETEERDGRTFRMFHRETDRARIGRNRAEIFDLHARALAWLEDYTQVAYPFGKFDFVLIPSFQFGGMEHPGAVFYNANSLLLDESATQMQWLARANVISHETAHMWFGDLVTMTWFNDVWMKEVFANFMAAKIVNPSFPTINHDLRFLVQHHPVAYEIDRTAGANPIRQPLLNLDEAGSLYGAIIYQKAPVVMRQLEMLIGPEGFRRGLRRYLALHGFANASWPDLIQVLDAETPHDLVAWSEAWVNEAGRPTIATDIDVRDGVVRRLTLRQSDTRGRGLVWPQHLTVAMGYDDQVRTFDVEMNDATIEVPGAIGLPIPRWILPAGGGLGYARFELDATSLAFFTESIHTIADPLTRGAALVAVWESFLDGDVSSTAMRQMLLAALRVESNELDLQLLLDQVRTTFWRFTAAEDRAAFSVELEPVLRQGLNRATTTSEKAAWFAAIRTTAMTAETLRWLESVWARREKVAGLPLAEVDEAELAADLALRDHPNSADILDAQLARMTNPDRKARFAFVLPALSSDETTRARFFEGLRDVGRRTREAWVLDAARYLHHPLRAAHSEALVVPALALTLEIQQTGDIFFPKRWADATLSGYQTAHTASLVRAFIDTLPASYPPRLRWILLSSTDPLFRAARQ